MPQKSIGSDSALGPHDALTIPHISHGGTRGLFQESISANDIIVMRILAIGNDALDVSTPHSAPSTMHDD